MKLPIKLGRVGLVLYSIFVMGLAGTYLVKVRVENPVRFYQPIKISDPEKIFLGPIAGIRRSDRVPVSDVLVEATPRAIVGRRSGQPKWQFVLASSKRQREAFISVSDRFVLIGSSDGILICLVRETGELQWSYNFKSARTAWSSFWKGGSDQVLLNVENLEQKVDFILLIDAVSGENKWNSNYIEVQSISGRNVVSCPNFIAVQTGYQSVAAYAPPSRDALKVWNGKVGIEQLSCRQDSLVVQHYNHSKVHHDPFAK
jgi:hypothetical protein